MIDHYIQVKIDASAELLEKARRFYELSEYDESKRCANDALALLEDLAERDDLGNDREESSQKYAVIGLLAHAYNRLQTISDSCGDYPLSLSQAEIALNFCERIGNLRRKADLLGNIGIVYMNLSNYTKALEYLQMALKMGEELGLTFVIGRILSNIGNAYISITDYTNALEYMEKALAIFEELGSTIGIATNFITIGNVYRALSDYTKAFEYYQKALTIYEVLGNKEGIAISLGNIGLVYQHLSDYTNALEYSRKALEMSEELGRKRGIASNLGNIGLVYQFLSKYYNALECFQKALAIYEEIGRKDGIAINLGHIGTTYAKQDFDGYDPAKAEEFLLKSVALFEEIGEKRNLYAVHKILADLFEGKERWKEAFHHITKYQDLKEEVQNEEVVKQAGLMEQRNEAAEREKTLAIERAEATATRNVLNLILPESIATRMIAGEKRIADYYSNISILFADIVGFTALATEVKPDVVVDLLNYVFDTFDEIIKRNGCEKIKTIGDGYMAVAGAPIECSDHAERIARAAIEMQQDIHLPDEIRKHLPEGTIFNIRVGIHSGAAVCGVIGRERFVWDVYSDAVNTASRMESHGEAGKIHCTEEFMRALSISSPQSPKSLRFTVRGKMHIKGKGMMKTYFMERNNYDE